MMYWWTIRWKWQRILCRARQNRRLGYLHPYIRAYLQVRDEDKAYYVSDED